MKLIFAIISHERESILRTHCWRMLDRWGVPNDRRVLGYSGGAYDEFECGYKYEQPVGYTAAYNRMMEVLREYAPDAYWVALDDDTKSLQYLIRQAGRFVYSKEVQHYEELMQLVNLIESWIAPVFPHAAAYAISYIDKRFWLRAVAEYPVLVPAAFWIWRPTPARDALRMVDGYLKTDFELILQAFKRNTPIVAVRVLCCEHKRLRQGGVEQQRATPGEEKAALKMLLERHDELLTLDRRRWNELRIKPSIPKVRLDLSSMLPHLTALAERFKCE